MLALTVAARHPELIACVVTGAGVLLPDETARPTARPLDVLVMNGSLDPVVIEDDHTYTIETFSTAGHRVVSRFDPVPHVIDEEQASAAAQFTTCLSASAAPP